MTKTDNGVQTHGRASLHDNALNQVTGADITTPSGATSVAYAYDHDGIRIGKTVNGIDITQYLVDKNRPYAQVLEEQRSTGSTISYVYGDTLLSQSTAGIPHYYLYDGLGSVRGLTDNAGTLTDAYTYDAYGNWLDKTGSTSNVYGYRDEQYDEALDAYYLRARYYQPGNGRFVSTDPVEGGMTNSFSLHRYIYANCDPVKHVVDSSGEFSMPEVSATVAIRGNLAAIAIGSVSEMLGLGVYSFLGENVTPDALVIGASANISAYFISEIITLAGLPIPSMPELMMDSGMAGGGAELILSVSSGQFGLVVYGFWAYQVSPRIQGKNIHRQGNINRLKIRFDGTVYQKYMFNVWDLSYEEINGVSWDFLASGAHTGVGIFFNPKKPFKDAPWGLTRVLLAGSIPDKTKPLSHSGFVASSYAKLVWEKMYNEWIVGTSSIAASMAAYQLQARFNPSAKLLTTFIWAEPTLWTQTMVSKVWWNKKSGYSIEKRLLMTREQAKFDGSGPGHMIFSLLGMY